VERKNCSKKNACKQWTVLFLSSTKADLVRAERDWYTNVGPGKRSERKKNTLFKRKRYGGKMPSYAYRGERTVSNWFDNCGKKKTGEPRRIGSVKEKKRKG